MPRDVPFVLTGRKARRAQPPLKTVGYFPTIPTGIDISLLFSGCYTCLSGARIR